MPICSDKRTNLDAVYEANAARCWLSISSACQQYICVAVGTERTYIREATVAAKEAIAVLEADMKLKLNAYNTTKQELWDFVE